MEKTNGVLSVILALVFAWSARAATIISQTSGNWTQAATWNGGVPGAADDVFIAAGHAVTNTGLDVRTINSLSVSGTLTHATNGTVEAHKLVLNIAGDLRVHAGGAIDAYAKGYQFAAGPGQGGSYGMGGSHGGNGSHGRDAGQTPGPTYGSITEPVTLGSGGGRYSSGENNAGGGAIRITAGGTMTIDGLISANGFNTGALRLNGGGSGGSVWLTASGISGTGVVSAIGGVGSAAVANDHTGGGGGGRVAVHLTGSDDFAAVEFRARGGTGTKFNAAAGTVYLQGMTDSPGQGRLVVDNNGAGTTMGETTDLCGNASVNYAFREVTLRNAGIIGIGSDDALTITTAVFFGDSGAGAVGVRIRGGRWHVPSAFIFSNLIVAVDVAGSSFSPGESLTVGAGGRLVLNKPHTITGDVSLADGSLMTHDKNTSNEFFKIDLTIDGSLSISAGADVNVDAMGFDGGFGSGKPVTQYRSGASHGGVGGVGWCGTPGLTYGCVISPTNIGSGASSYAGCKTDGGGAVRLAISGTTLLDGLISANGTNIDVNANSGGSGGSVWLTTSALSGSGMIRANGAPGFTGGADPRGNSGGGGGRVAVILAGSDSFGSVIMQARGGANNAYSAGAGTVYLETVAQRNGRGIMIFDNEGVPAGGYGELPAKLNACPSNQLARAVLVVTNLNTQMNLTEHTGIQDLMVHTGAYLVLGPWTLTVNSREHWLDDPSQRGPGATNRVDRYDQILWIGSAQGTMLRCW